MSQADKNQWGHSQGENSESDSQWVIEGQALVSLLLEVGYVQSTGALTN